MAPSDWSEIVTLSPHWTEVRSTKKLASVRAEDPADDESKVDDSSHPKPMTPRMEARQLLHPSLAGLRCFCPMSEPLAVTCPFSADLRSSSL